MVIRILPKDKLRVRFPYPAHSMIYVDQFLKLEPLSLASAETLRKIYSDKENVRFMSVETVHWQGGIEEAKDSVKKFLASKDDLVWEIKYEGVGVGLIGLENIEADKMIADLWYILDRDYQGKGLMIKSLQAFLKYLKEKGWRQINAEVKTENEVSIDLLLKLGFIKTGKVNEDEEGFRLVFGGDDFVA